MSYMTRFHQFYFSVTVYTHSSTLPPFPLLILLLLLLLLLNHSLHEIKTTLCPRCVYTEPLECSSVRVPATATLVNPPAYIGQTPTDGQASCMQSRHRNQKARRFFSKHYRAVPSIRYAQRSTSFTFNSDTRGVL